MVDKSKGMRIRLRAKSTSKILEKELRRKARKLKENPHLILPKCGGRCTHCPFEKLKRSLERVVERADDPEALERLSRGGDKLARALAGFLKSLHEERIPYLALLRTPSGEVGYVQRGKTSTEKMVAVQYYDKPSLKAIGYLDYVKKKGLTMFVTEDDLICTGKEPIISEGVLKALEKAFNKKVKQSGKVGNLHVLRCRHLNTNSIVSLEPERVPYLRLTWERGGLQVAICERCSAEIGGNAYHRLGGVVLRRKLKKEVKVEVQVAPVNLSEDCPEVNITPPPAVDYYSGELDDSAYIKKSLKSYREALSTFGGPLFIADGVCYGRDLDKFLDALKTVGEERRLLEEVLREVKEPVIVSELNTYAVLRRYWKKSGLKALRKVLGDEAVAKKVFNNLSLDSYTPGAMIAEGRKILKEKSLRERLPEPIDPPEMIDVVREMAIAYLSRGPEGVGKVLMKIRSEDIKTRAAVYAFIQAFSLQKYSSWSYSPEEIGYAQGLEKVIKDVVTEDPRKHVEALKRLWKETGSTRELRFRERS